MLLLLLCLITHSCAYIVIYEYFWYSITNNIYLFIYLYSEFLDYFDNMDINSDGRISSVEFATFIDKPDVFTYLDINNDGGITREEITSAIDASEQFEPENSESENDKSDPSQHQEFH